jgi:protein-S-isoprenylcysteine O-methyltransferase Ste14
MTFGAITYYLSISLLAGSFSAIILVVLFSLVFVAYIKLVEEKELEAKFGEEYRMYKRKTPFLVPKFWRWITRMNNTPSQLFRHYHIEFRRR